MPRRRNQKKPNVKRNRNRVNNKKKKVYKKNYANNQVVSYRASRLMPFPPRYQTKFNLAIYGAIAVGTAGGAHFASLNSVLTPLLSGGWPGSSLPLTLNPTGLTSLLNLNLYTRFRVFASKINIEFLPQSLSDTVEVTVTPSDSTSIPVSTGVAMSQPYTKSLFMSSSKMNSRKGSYISNYITVHQFYGVKKRAIDDDLSLRFTGSTTADPLTQLYWVINYATPDGMPTTTPLEYRLKITYYTELYANSTANLLQT